MITVQNLSLCLNGHVILDDVSFTLRAGEYVGLIGPNGAGKTSLVKTLLGMHRPTSGTVTMAPEVKIGYVPQRYRLSAVVPVSVREVLRMATTEPDDTLAKLLQTVELDASFLGRNFHTLSGGQQQRVVIARALAQRPTVLVFDEPLTGVDYDTKQKIYTLLAGLRQREGLTILFVSHEVDQVVAECDRVLCLNQTLHTGCHPLDFARGVLTPCPVGTGGSPTVRPVHHHHDDHHDDGQHQRAGEHENNGDDGQGVSGTHNPDCC